jgi:shikimate dehydrogenase
VLGAGGGARAVVWALREAGAAEVMVWNRTPERAAELTAQVGGKPVAAPEPADLLVNCTSVGLPGGPSALAELALSPGQLAGYRCVVDLAYGDRETELAATARAQGASVVDGLEILVQQGALSFEGWTGRAAPLEHMRAAVRTP